MNSDLRTRQFKEDIKCSFESTTQNLISILLWVLLMLKCLKMFWLMFHRVVGLSKGRNDSKRVGRLLTLSWRLYQGAEVQHLDSDVSVVKRATKHNINPPKHSANFKWLRWSHLELFCFLPSFIRLPQKWPIRLFSDIHYPRLTEVVNFCPL